MKRIHEKYFYNNKRLRYEILYEYVQKMLVITRYKVAHGSSRIDREICEHQQVIEGATCFPRSLMPDIALDSFSL